MLIKHNKTKTVLAQYFINEDEAIQWWASYPIADEWEIIYLEDRKPSGHRYALTYVKSDERGVLYSKYIICFSKKEALLLKNKIERINQDYITLIKRLY